jgi:DNA helicase HerA-like ATPase
MADDGVLIGRSDQPQYLLLNRANRHGVVAGATGTGKTVTLQILAQGLSDAGVPVFAADVKGDLSGVAVAGAPNEKMQARAAGMDLTLRPAGAPVIFWDLFGEQGHPIRATVSEMGPLLLSRLMNLTEAQEGIMNIAFRLADEEGLLLLDMKDLQALTGQHRRARREIGSRYGNVTKPPVGAIQRTLLVLETAGREQTSSASRHCVSSDIMRTTRDGRGAISVLAADKLMMNPRLYATFLLWLMSELFEVLPEVGDPDKPKLVFFFDEAHLLFDEAPQGADRSRRTGGPPDPLERRRRLFRHAEPFGYSLKRSGQLGNRVQHALRAYTPREQRGLKAAADSFRTNPAFDTADTIQQLGVGEALVSVLDAAGAPTVVQKTSVRPPDSRLGPLTATERAAIMAQSPVRGLYDQAQDRESAYERLHARTAQKQAEAEAPAPATPRPRASNRESMGEALAKSMLRTIGTQVAREVMRGVLGSLRRR